MATRMQQRRGTAAQWVSTNGGDGPILEAGEIGFETDTGKFKIGDGTNHWVDLDYFLDESDIDGITGDYVLANTLGQANGVATLDSSGKLTGSQIPGIDELAQDAVDLALVAGTGISKTYNDNANTITIAVDTSVIATKAELAEVSQDSVNDAIVAGTGIAKSYNDNANTITISTSNIPNASLANSEVTINGFSISLGGSATYSSDNIGEGTTNLYFTNARSRATVSGGTGLDYNASTGVFDIDSTVTTNTGSQTLTNKSIDLANNTVTGTVAQFNSALSDANFVTTADTGAVTSTMIADGTIVDADINASAAIAQSKIANLTTDLGNKQDKVSGVSDTEIGYLDGVTSNVQSQLNSKAALAGAAFTGNISTTGNLQVDGNFTVNGSNVLVSATQIQIEDSILQLAHENAANTVDIGIVAGYNDGTAKHSGLVKDATDAKWKLFKGVTDEPTTTVNFAQATLDDLAVGGLEVTSLSVGTVSNTEIGYLDGVTSNVQAQLNAKAPINNASFTGTFSAPSGTITSTMLADETIVNADISNTAAIALSKLATDPLARANHTGTQTASTISDFNEAAQDAVGGILGSGLTYTDASNTITVDSTVVQLRVANVTDTEIGYLDGVTSAIQTQLNGKAPSNIIPAITGNITLVKSQLLGYTSITSPNANTIRFLTSNTSGLIAALNTIPNNVSVTYTDDAMSTSGTFTKTGLAFDNGSGQVDLPISNLQSAFIFSDANSDPIFVAAGGGTSGKYLTNDGTNASWDTVSSYSAPTLGSTSIASGATVTTIAGLTLTAPTLTGTVTASGDINLSAVNGPGSLIDELNLLMMGAL